MKGKVKWFNADKGFGVAHAGHQLHIVEGENQRLHQGLAHENQEADDERQNEQGANAGVAGTHGTEGRIAGDVSLNGFDNAVVPMLARCVNVRH